MSELPPSPLTSHRRRILNPDGHITRLFPGQHQDAREIRYYHSMTLTRTQTYIRVVEHRNGDLERMDVSVAHGSPLHYPILSTSIGTPADPGTQNREPEEVSTLAGSQEPPWAQNGSQGSSSRAATASPSSSSYEAQGEQESVASIDFETLLQGSRLPLSLLSSTAFCTNDRRAVILVDAALVACRVNLNTFARVVEGNSAVQLSTSVLALSLISCLKALCQTEFWLPIEPAIELPDMLTAENQRAERAALESTLIRTTQLVRSISEAQTLEEFETIFANHIAVSRPETLTDSITNVEGSPNLPSGSDAGTTRIHPNFTPYPRFIEFSDGVTSANALEVNSTLFRIRWSGQQVVLTNDNGFQVTVGSTAPSPGVCFEGDASDFSDDRVVSLAYPAFAVSGDINDQLHDVVSSQRCLFYVVTELTSTIPIIILVDILPLSTAGEFASIIAAAGQLRIRGSREADGFTRSYAQSPGASITIGTGEARVMTTGSVDDNSRGSETNEDDETMVEANLVEFSSPDDNANDQPMSGAQAAEVSSESLDQSVPDLPVHPRNTLDEAGEAELDHNSPTNRHQDDHSAFFRHTDNQGFASRAASQDDSGSVYDHDSEDDIASRIAMIEMTIRVITRLALNPSERQSSGSQHGSASRYEQENADA